MKRLPLFGFITLIHISIALSSAANQKNLGDWAGRLDEKFKKTKIIAHFQNKSGISSLKIDIPDESLFGLSADKINIEDNTIVFEVQSYEIKFEGKINLEKYEINGVFDRGGISSELCLIPWKAKATVIPEQLGFTFGPFIPKDFRPSSGEGECLIHLFNETPAYASLFLIDADGNLYQESNPVSNHNKKVIYISPGGRSNPENPFNLKVGSAFAILSWSGTMIGYGKVWKSGECKLVLE